jgi:hypothetical protein
MMNSLILGPMPSPSRLNAGSSGFPEAEALLADWFTPGDGVFVGDGDGDGDGDTLESGCLSRCLDVVVWRADAL